MEPSSTVKALSRFERLLLLLGLLLIAIYVAARVYSGIFSHLEVRSFLQARHPLTSSESPDSAEASAGSPVFRLWSKNRIEAYKVSLGIQLPPALAVLNIPAIHLEVPVLEGTDDLALNQGVGHIEGTGIPGEAGNVGIAGHRDGFFRGLKDIQIGDAIDVTTRNKTIHYLVDEVLIVSPDDVSVLQPRPKPSLTLVTCYPFYFVGSAPQRYIVHATITNSSEHKGNGQASQSLEKGGNHETN
jgi:sortase A